MRPIAAVIKSLVIITLAAASAGAATTLPPLTAHVLRNYGGRDGVGKLVLCADPRGWGPLVRPGCTVNLVDYAASFHEPASLPIWGSTAAVMKLNHEAINAQTQWLAMWRSLPAAVMQWRDG